MLRAQRAAENYDRRDHIEKFWRFALEQSEIFFSDFREKCCSQQFQLCFCVGSGDYQIFFLHHCSFCVFDWLELVCTSQDNIKSWSKLPSFLWNVKNWAKEKLNYMSLRNFRVYKKLKVVCCWRFFFIAEIVDRVSLRGGRLKEKLCHVLNILLESYEYVCSTGWEHQISVAKYPKLFFSLFS